MRAGYEAFNSGDLEGSLALFDPDVEVRLAQDAGTVLGLDFRPVYHGIDGFMKFLGTLSEVWEEFRWEPEEYVDAGDAVVVMIRMKARGKASGVVVEQPMAHLCTVRDGKLARHETFWERDSALQAAGLAS